MEPARLELKKLTKRYGTVWGLKGVSITFTPGVYGLLGPNGAGKSTLMKLLTQNLQPDRGGICYQGKNIRAMGEEYRSLIGYVPQQQGLYEGFTGRRFLRYVASLKGLSEEDTTEQVEKLSRLVNMQDHLDQKMSAYSGGMRQRILIAQALLGDPRILILDEPTAGLDPKERIRIRSIIAESAYDRIVIYATHVVSDVEFIAKKLLLLDGGRLLREGTTAELLDDLRGQVWDLYCDRVDTTYVQEHFLVGNIQEQSDQRICMRVLSETRPVGWDCREVPPTLEDVYLKMFGERG
jgi:ABC-type multidrug transport system ATPase subunit